MKRKEHVEQGNKSTEPEATKAAPSMTEAGRVTSFIQQNGKTKVPTVPRKKDPSGDDNDEQRNRKILKKQKRKQRKKGRKMVQKKSEAELSDESNDNNEPPPQKRRKLEEEKSRPDPSDASKSATDLPLNHDKEETVNYNRDDDDDDDEDDDDDDMLLAAAEQWASDALQDGSGSAVPNQNDLSSPKGEASNSLLDAPSLTVPQSLSLHVTQLPYDASELDLRRLFAEHGCSVTSIRLVYDKDTRGQKTVFRGVAFVDVLNHESYNSALKLNHKASIRGRKLNIRPTRSKEELANIVVRTRELVQEKIRQQRAEATDGGGKGAAGTSEGRKVGDNGESKRPPSEKKMGDNVNDDRKISDKDKKKNSPAKKKNSPAKKTNNPAKKKNSPAKKTKGTHKDGVEGKGDKDGDDAPVKLSKKERNRRAAILLQLKNNRGRQQKR
jgi:RNA recognition motif-containing protein